MDCLEWKGMFIVEKRRIVYLDALRILACLCVIYMHINERGQYMFAYREIGSALYFAEMFISMFTKMAVPVFFAISGALMLHRQMDLKTLWQKKILRIGTVLALFSAIVYAVAAAQGHAQWGLKTFIFGLYDSTWSYSYWYLYAYLGFLMVSPVLGTLARSLGKRDFLYLLALAFVFRSLLPGMEQLRWEGVHKLNPSLNLSCITADIVIYPLLGYYLHHRMDERECRKIAPLLIAAASLLTAAACYMTYRETTKTWMAIHQNYHELFAPFWCAAVFAAARGYLAGVGSQSRAAGWISRFSAYTFGVYLLHLLILQNMGPALDAVWNALMAVHLPQAIASAVYCMAVFVICMAPVWVIKKIPGIGKWIA